MESRHIRILNYMASVGGSVDSVISINTMCSVSICENDIPGSSLDGSKYSVSPKMPRRFSMRPPFLWILCIRILVYFFLNTVTGTTMISPNNNIVGVFFIHIFCPGSRPIQELSQNKLVNIQTLSELPNCLRSEYSQLSMINFLQGPILGKMCVTRFDFQVRTT